MKKIFVLLLAAVMCFSFAACGGDKETNNNNGSQTNNSGSQQEEMSNGVIEITLDNWQDYFEIKDGVHIYPDGDLSPDTVFAIKEGYSVASIELSINYSYSKEWRYVEVDEETNTITIGELVEGKTVEEIKNDLYINGFSDENGGIEYSLCVGWQSANDTKTVCSNVEIINIQGTLQINK